MNFDLVTINGAPARVAAVIDVTSPFTVGWTAEEAAAYVNGHVTMALPVVKKMHRILAGLHLPKRLRATSPAGTWTVTR